MTAAEIFADYVQTTVSSGGTTAPSSGATETWTVGSSTGFPAAVTGTSQFHVADIALPGEVFLVTNVSGTTWSITRGAGSTTPVAHTAGFTVQQVVPAGIMAAWVQAGNGDIGGTGAAPTVVRIQGVAVTSAQATLVSDLNNATARTATATLLAGEETIFSGSTASQTLTLPASPPSSAVNTITNAASVSVTLAPGAGATLSNFGTTGNITIPAGYTFAVVYIGTTWYVQSAGPSDFAKSSALGVPSGGTGVSTVTAAALLAGNGTGAVQSVTTATAAGAAGLSYGLVWTGTSTLPTWQLLRGSGHVATNQTTTSTGYSTITGLSVAALPIGSYLFRGVIFCDSSNASGVAQISVSTPAESLLAFGGTTFSGGGTLGLIPMQGTAGNLGGSNSNTTTYPVQIWGSVTTTATGTFAVTFSTNNGSFTTTARAGSCMEIVPA